MQLKEQPEDFIVEELNSLHPQSSGKYLYCLLRKRNLSTLDAVQEVADFFHIPLSFIGYAGNKDKRAVTSQYISLFEISQHQIASFSHKKITLTFFGYGKERITLGDLQGNSFIITVRDLDAQKLLSLPRIKNLFDEQRFGVEKINVAVGKALLQKRFRDACTLLHLSFEGKNYVAALRTLPRKLLRLYIASYQSFLWNAVAVQVENRETVPLFGFLTTLAGEVGLLYRTLLDQERVQQENFLMQSMPELAVEGSERPLYAIVNNFSYLYDLDELHSQKFKCTLRFSLPKGMYATLVVKRLFSSD